jgi:hypothetical protein
MHHEDSPEDPRSYYELERDVLYHLTTPEEGQPLWSVDDLNREMDRTDVIDQRSALYGISGCSLSALIHMDAGSPRQAPNRP